MTYRWESTSRREAVVTWESPAGTRMDICEACEEEHRQRDDWPRDNLGVELCQVYHGAHTGECESPHHAQYAWSVNGEPAPARLVGEGGSR